MEPTERDISELRSSFLKKCEAENVVELGTFHPDDINRAKTDDSWLRRFLLHHDNDQKEALNMLVETCDWRKKFGANDNSYKNVNSELLEGGAVFASGRDRDGKAILVFKSKKHVKGVYSQDDLKKHLVYWMERMERQEKGNMISIFFDMDGAGLSNMDMDYTKYIIHLFKNYYPHFLNYIIVFEMAWVLHAAFKLIKSWLPPKAIKKIKFLNKSNLKEVVDPEEALRCWGGRNDYVFVFEPESEAEEHIPVNEECKKKVHFADGSPLQDYLNDSGFVESTASLTTNSIKLSVSPSELLPFAYEGNDLTSSILLKNEDVQCLSYKIKTTSPKKFRVRPSVGILHPDSSTTVTVVLQTGYELPGLTKDKFLIMSLPVESGDMSQESVMELWKNTSEEEVSRYKLRCSFSQNVKGDGTLLNGSVYRSQSVVDQKLSKITSDMIKLQATVCSLKEDVKVILRQQWIIATAILFLACIIVYMSSSASGVIDEAFRVLLRFLAYSLKCVYRYAEGIFRMYASPGIQNEKK